MVAVVRGVIVRVAGVVAVALVVSLAAARGGPQDDKSEVEGLPAGKWVTVRPPLGLVPRPIRKYLTDTEISVISRVQRMINGLESAPGSPVENGSVAWHVEPGVEFSPTFGLQRDVLLALDRAIESRVSVTRGWHVNIVVARSRSFIRETLARIGCVPNLSRTNGVVLMGAAVCDRRVIVSNLTGFLWVVRADQTITSSLESRKEPTLSRIPYRIVMRNSDALAHEWTHIWRAAGLGGLVRGDEPAWFSEGFAEFWSGVAKVLAFPGRIPYRSHHVVRLRDFVNWPAMCPEPLRAYRTVSSLANGCEYHVGLAAVEYLYAKYHSLEKTLTAFSRAGEYMTFEEGFQGTFGISLSRFEKEADAYIRNLRRADAAGRVSRSGR